jgi:hypothetical protein
MRTHGGIIFFGLMILVLSGCASVGPGSVSRDRFDYVTSISESWKHQILLNIVKTRYIEPLSFVDVGQIIAGYSLETGVNLLGKGTLSNFSSSSSIEAGVSGKFTDRPTITYTPMTGNTFIRSLMTPLFPSQVLFAVQSGVPADMIFKLGVSSINGLRNENVTIKGYIPPEAKFVRVIEIMNSLQMAGAINVKIINQKDSHESALLSFPSTAVDAEVSALVREFCDLLGLDQGADQYKIVSGNIPGNNREIAMQTSSVMRIMAFLAARVEVPEKDMAEKRALAGIREAVANVGREGRFVIRSSNGDGEPKEAFAAVKYRNHWFWIDDRDIASKQIISFLVLVFTLADTGSDKPLPLVTIPAQ